MARILLIETDRLLAISLQNFLKTSGHVVEWHVDPQAATDSADLKCPDAIVLDLLLATRSGVEFLYELRSYPDWQDVPVVLFSTVSPGELRDSYGGLKQLNVSAYHYKPITSLSELAKSINRCLQTTAA